MDANISNGGIIVKVNNTLMATDLGNYQGVYMEKEDAILFPKEHLPWFINVDGSKIYYSNQRDGNHLWMFDIFTDQSESLLDKPVYMVLHSGNYLYYLDEINKSLYRMNLHKPKEVERILNQHIRQYILTEQYIYYLTDKELSCCNLNGEQQKKLLGITSSFILYHQDYIVLGDLSQENRLTTYNVHTEEIQYYEEIEVGGLNHSLDYIYCINRKNDSTIVRVNLKNSQMIRMGKEKASHLHIIEDTIYFLNLNDQASWYKIPIDGGASMKCFINE